MQTHSSIHYVILLIALVTSSASTCMALPELDPKAVVQICQALSDPTPGKMPKIVSPDVSRQFLDTYSSVSGKLVGCLSAIEETREPKSSTFVVQHARFEARWNFSVDERFVTAISVTEVRPITLADDERWRSPFAPDSSNLTLASGRGGSDGSQDPNIVEFLYATNRRDADINPRFSGQMVAGAAVNGWRPVRDYSGERSAELSFGAVRVRVPEGHSIGKLELASSSSLFGWSIYNDSSKHFTIRGIRSIDEETWVRHLSSVTGKKALIFIHGFNTKFRDAAFRTAQIIWDLQYRGTAVLFSWPSRGNIADYEYDRDSALYSREALLRVIADLRRADFSEIDIVAHSMGNLIAVDALANSAMTSSPAAIAQFVMAAPDVDRDMFVQDIPRVAKVAKGLTLYASANDKALALSKRVAGNIPRAGDVPASGPIVMTSVSTIDASAIGDELFGLNHSSFATTRNILNDLKLLLETGAPPPRLAEIRAYPEPPLTATHFRYAP